MARRRAGDEQQPSLDSWWAEPEEVRVEQVRSFRVGVVEGAGADGPGPDTGSHRLLLEGGGDSPGAVDGLVAGVGGTGPGGGEDFHHKAGRIEAAKMRAEEMIRAELLVPPQELQEADDPDQPGPLAEVIEAWRDVTTEDLDR